LEHLGIKGINFGTGYYDNHTDWSHAIINETTMMIYAFERFYEKYKDTYMPHTPSRRNLQYGHTWSGYTGREWDWTDDDEDYAYIRRGMPHRYDATSLKNEQWLKSEEKGITRHIPAWRAAEYLKEHPGAVLTPVAEVEWAKKTSPPANIEVSPARWEYDDEPPIDSHVYITMFEELVNKGLDEEQSHREAWLAARSCYLSSDPYNDKCLICGRPECAGMHTCEVCGITTHNDNYCKSTGMCLNCHAKIDSEEVRM